jgi:hypothetical protein
VPIPTPARIRIDLEEIGIPVSVEAPVKTGIIAAPQAPEKHKRPVHDTRPGGLWDGSRNGPYRPIRRLRQPLGLKAANGRKTWRKRTVVLLSNRKHPVVPRGVANNAAAQILAGKEFFDKDWLVVPEPRADVSNCFYKVLGIGDHALLGNTKTRIPKVGFHNNWKREREVEREIPRVDEESPGNRNSKFL